MYFDLAPADIPKPQRPRYNAENVREYVNQRSLYFGYSGDVIRGPMRHREYVQVRAKISSELRDLGYSLPSIGRALGGRHHATILYLLRGGRHK